MHRSQALQGVIGGLLLPGLVACGTSTDIDLTETLTVAMTAVFEAPADAVGNAEPKSLTFTLTGAAMTAADGTAVDLFAAAEAEATEYVIISRGQIVFEADISEHVDTAFSALTVTFDPTIKGKGKYEDEMTATLTNASAAFAEAFTIEKAKSLDLEINVQWKSIVTRDEEADPPTEVMSSPTFVADLTSG